MKLKKIPWSLLVYWSLAAVGLATIAGIFGATQVWYYESQLGLAAKWFGVAMLIFDSLEIGGSFAEFHPVDFNEGFILVGHDGPHHVNIAQGKPVIRSLTKYHGKPGSGASVEFALKEGLITMMSVGQKADGSFKFVIAEGESKAGPIPATGNTNTRGFFAPDPVTFLHAWLKEGPTHHFALGVGHHAEDLLLLADAIGIDAVDVTIR